MQGIVEVVSHRHGFSHERLPVWGANAAAGSFPDRDAGLERGNSFSDLAFPDQCLAKRTGPQQRPQHGHAVLPTDPITFLSTLAQADMVKTTVELVHPHGQRKSD